MYSSTKQALDILVSVHSVNELGLSKVDGAKKETFRVEHKTSADLLPEGLDHCCFVSKASTLASYHPVLKNRGAYLTLIGCCIYTRNLIDQDFDTCCRKDNVRVSPWSRPDKQQNTISGFVNRVNYT